MAPVGLDSDVFTIVKRPKDIAGVDTGVVKCIVNETMTWGIGVEFSRRSRNLNDENVPNILDKTLFVDRI